MSTYTQILYQIVFATKNQKDQHRKVSFPVEYTSLLKQHEIEFNEKYLF